MTGRARGLRTITLKRSSGSKKWNVTSRSRVVLRTWRTAPVAGASAGASTTPSGRRRNALLMRSVRSRIMWTVSAAAGSSAGSVSVSGSSWSSGRSAVIRSPSIEVPTMRARIWSGRSRPSTSRRQRPSSTASFASSPGVSVTLYRSSPHCTPSDCQYCSTSIRAPYRIALGPSPGVAKKSAPPPPPPPPVAGAPTVLSPNTASRWK